MGTLSAVILGTEVLCSCLSHALGTEHQEIMGLLLGKYINEGRVAQITRVMVLTRKDKQRDRVEVCFLQVILMEKLLYSSTLNRLAQISWRWPRLSPKN